MADKLKVSVPRMKEDGEGLKGCFEKIPNMVKDLDQSMAMLSTCWRDIPRPSATRCVKVM